MADVYGESGGGAYVFRWNFLSCWISWRSVVSLCMSGLIGIGGVQSVGLCNVFGLSGRSLN